MKIFSDSKQLVIKYTLKPNPYNEKGFLGESWGQFELWVGEKDVCKLRNGQGIRSYEANLIYIVEWLCENLQYILSDDQLALPVEGSNVIELYNKSIELETDDETEIDNWFEIRQEWYSRHNWFWNKGGSFLPEVFFRKVKDSIEIVWDNVETYKDRGVEFINSKGIQYVPIVEFKNVICCFLVDIIEAFITRIPENAELKEMKAKIEMLIKQ